MQMTPPAPVPATETFNVLLIDDEVMIHHLVRARLTGEPLTLHTATDAATGLAMAAKLHPDLILLDVELGDPKQCIDSGCADGFEVCRRLMADPATAQTQVIFLSALCTPEQKIRGLDLGAVDYITKPFDPAELRARVRASLRTKHLLNLLATRAMLDGLTGLWNRTFLQDRLAVEVARSNRYATPLSLVMIDVDHFKRVNDTYGHPVGDEVLRQVARTLTSLCRQEDLVCRYGGEEFAVITVGSNLAGTISLAERMRVGIATLAVTARGQPVAVTASFGVTTLCDDTPQAAVDRADRALYQAKQAGRDRVVTLDCDPTLAIAG